MPFSTNFDFQLASNPTIYNLGSIEPIQILVSVLQDNGGGLSTSTLRQLHAIYNGPEVWDAVASFDLLDTVDDQNSTLTMRAAQKFRIQRLDQFLHDSLGTNNVAPFLLDLINRFRSQTFDLGEFEAVLAEHGVNLTEQAGDLIRTAALPGFLASDPSLRRLENQEQPRYESTFLIQNREPVSGPVKISLTYQNGEDRSGPYVSQSRPSLLTMLVEANQSLRVVIESSNPVQQILVEPYLSLNRSKLRLDLPETEAMRGQELISGDLPYIKSITAVDQETGTLNKSITIDDLDTGFSVVEPDRSLIPKNLFTQFVRNLLGEMEVPLDQGLPKYSLFDDWRIRSAGWYRWTDPTAIGSYRRTFTIAVRGDGRAFAKFNTTLPESGRWQLEYHLPEGHFEEEVGFGGSSSVIRSYATVGSFDLEVRYGLTASTHTLDALNLAPGWHSIGIFDLAAEEVDVIVSNKTGSHYQNVFADAIRWTPVQTEE